MTALETGQRLDIKIGIVDTREDLLKGAILETLVKEGRVPFRWDLDGDIGVYFHDGPMQNEKAAVFIVPPPGTRIGDEYRRNGYLYEFFTSDGRSLGDATRVDVRKSDLGAIDRRIKKALEKIDIRRRNPSLRDRVARRRARLYREIVDLASTPHS